jgi:hypothetical protein
MRFFTFAAVTVAFVVSTVSAKIGFGSCSETISQTSWTAYSDGTTGFAQDHFYNHEIIAMDAQFDQLLGLATKFGVKIPFDIQCTDLGTVPPFNELAKAVKSAADAAFPGQTAADGVKFNYPAKEAFELLFPPRADAIVRMVDFNSAQGTEAEYYFACVDSFSFPAILAQVRGMGIPIPPEAIKVIDVVNKLSVILKKLNITLRIEGGVVVGARPTGAAHTDALKLDFTGDVAGYDWAKMKVVEKASCPV